MAKIAKAPYRTHDDRSFEEEWGCHRNISEWWYATGYFTTDAGPMYSYQFTLIRTPVLGLVPNVLMLALTDFATGKHIYSQKVALTGRKVAVDSRTVRFDNAAEMVKDAQGMRFTGRHKEFALDLMLEYGKGAFWHCDNGVLRMGVDEPKETTLYFSYPNMPTSGTMTLHGKAHAVNGKSWFDKQGGPYSIRDRKTHWEWFSLRFFDDEELMLFTFPQNSYQDGTYIPQSGSARRLTEYSITPLDFVTINGARFSCGWSLDVPGCKGEHYTIRPLLKGQVNLAYCEQLAGIYNPESRQVGLCFVELLPGVYNEKFPFRMFARVE
jgi:predicted secreted hydrolase